MSQSLVSVESFRMFSSVKGSFLKNQNIPWIRKTIGHLPYIIIISPLPGILRVSVMKTELYVAMGTPHFKQRVGAMFESILVLYLH